MGSFYFLGKFALLVPSSNVRHRTCGCKGRLHWCLCRACVTGHDNLCRGMVIRAVSILYRAALAWTTDRCVASSCTAAHHTIRDILSRSVLTGTISTMTEA